MIPSVYIDLEDDVAKVVARVKREKSPELVLVCPKRCQLFSDSINLRLLKKQTDLLKKQIFILTMDERGQVFAKEAGFELKYLSKSRAGFSTVSDIQIQPKAAPETEFQEEGKGALSKTVKNLGDFVSGLVSKKPSDEEKIEVETKTVFDDQFNGAPGAKHPSFKKPHVQIVNPFDFRTDKKRIKDKSLSGEGNIIKKSAYGKILTLSLALALIIVLSLVLFVLPSADVIIYAKYEPVTRDFDISLDNSIKEIDVQRLIIPATKVEDTVTLKSKFKSQGKKDVGNKATGSVRIYNFTGQTLNLRTETTSLTGGSATYRLAEDAMQIKPTKYKNAQLKEIDLSSLNEPFEIMAVNGGEDSNLPAGVRLEITNQVFGSRPQVLYAKTETPISGGTSRFLSVISKDDLTNAQAQLGNQALEQIQAKLAGQSMQFSENSYRMEALEFSSNMPVDTETPSFEAGLTAKITGLAFSQNDLKNLVVERISQTLAQNRYLKTQNDFKLQYKIRNLDLSLPTGALTVHFEGKAVNKINLDGLPAKLVGKSKTQAGELLQSMAEVEKAEITLAPSWQTNFPWFVKKIKLNVVD